MSVAAPASACPCDTLWLKRWGLNYGYPDDYTVVDLETTGTELLFDLVTDVGVCVVRNRVEVERRLLVLDWTSSDIDQDWLRARIGQTKAEMAAKGLTYHVSYDRMARHRMSSHPHHAFAELLDYIEAARRDKAFIVGHNICGFDAPFIEKNARLILQRDVNFRDNELFDTGVIEKGLQVPVHIWPGQSLFDLYLRVDDAWGRGVKWSLSKHCVEKYGLDKKFNLDMSLAHSADFDAMLNHLLLEHYRHEADGKTGVLNDGR